MRAEANTAATAGSAQNTIMIIEDNEGDIELARIAFEETDYAIIFMRSAEEALEYLHEHPLPDLILLDLNMPRTSGKEFLEIIKHIDTLSAIPVILLSSSGMLGDIQDCYRLHASGYIVKPSSTAERAEMIRHVTRFLK